MLLAFKKLLILAYQTQVMGDNNEQDTNFNENKDLSMNGSERKSGFEAEDIVADAIKLNVDDDLNEQRYVS